MRITEFENGNINIRRFKKSDYVVSIADFLQKLTHELQKRGFEVRISSENSVFLEGKTFTFTWADICEYNYYYAIKLRQVI